MSLPKLLDEMVIVLNKLQAIEDERNEHGREEYAPRPEINYSWQRSMRAAEVRRKTHPAPLLRPVSKGEGRSRHQQTGKYYERRFKRIVIGE